MTRGPGGGSAGSGVGRGPVLGLLGFPQSPRTTPPSLQQVLRPTHHHPPTHPPSLTTILTHYPSLTHPPARQLTHNPPTRPYPPPTLSPSASTVISLSCPNPALTKAFTYVLARFWRAESTAGPAGGVRRSEGTLSLLAAPVQRALCGRQGPCAPASASVGCFGGQSGKVAAPSAGLSGLLHPLRTANPCLLSFSAHLPSVAAPRKPAGSPAGARPSTRCILYTSSGTLGSITSRSRASPRYCSLSLVLLRRRRRDCDVARCAQRVWLCARTLLLALLDPHSSALLIAAALAPLEPPTTLLTHPPVHLLSAPPRPAPPTHRPATRPAPPRPAPPRPAPPPHPPVRPAPPRPAPPHDGLQRLPQLLVLHRRRPLRQIQHQAVPRQDVRQLLLLVCGTPGVEGPASLQSALTTACVVASTTWSRRCWQARGRFFFSAPSHSPALGGCCRCLAHSHSLLGAGQQHAGPTNAVLLLA